MKKIGKITFGVLLFLLTVPLSAVSLTATTQGNKIKLYDVFEIEVSAILNKNTNVEFENFQIQSNGVRYLNNSIVQSISNINGNITFSRNLTIQLKATKIGRHTLGPFSAIIDGKRYTSNTVTIDVEQRINNYLQPRSNRLVDNLIFIAESDKKEAFTNEQIILKFYLLFRLNVREYSDFELQNKDFLWKEWLPTEDIGNQGRVLFDGDLFSAVEIKRYAVFFTENGEKKIDEQMIQCIFELEDEFGIMRRQRVQLKSQSLFFKIHSLPTQGQPSQFLGDVGSFSVSANNSHLKPALGQVFRLPIVVKGSGNLMLLSKPKLALPSDAFELVHVSEKIKFERNSRSLNGEKIFEMALRALKTGDVDLPVFSLAYFDPVARRYFEKASIAQKVTVSNNVDFDETNSLNFDYAPVTQLNSFTLFKEKLSFLSMVYSTTLALVIFFFSGFMIRSRRSLRKKRPDYLRYFQRICEKKSKEADYQNLSQNQKWKIMTSTIQNAANSLLFELAHPHAKFQAIHYSITLKEIQSQIAEETYNRLIAVMRDLEGHAFSEIVSAEIGERDLELAVQGWVSEITEIFELIYDEFYSNHEKSNEN